MENPFENFDIFSMVNPKSELRPGVLSDAQVNKLREITDQADNLVKEVKKVLDWPGEPHADNLDEACVITFEKNYGDDKSYRFAGIRANRVWYITGKGSNRGPYTWADLIQFIGSREPEFPKVFVAIDWAEA